MGIIAEYSAICCTSFDCCAFYRNLRPWIL